jgi:hypothetical protein
MLKEHEYHRFVTKGADTGSVHGHEYQIYDKKGGYMVTGMCEI